MRNAVVYDLCRRIREPSFSSIHTLTTTHVLKQAPISGRHFRKPTFFVLEIAFHVRTEGYKTWKNYPDT